MDRILRENDRTLGLALLSGAAILWTWLHLGMWPLDLTALYYAARFLAAGDPATAYAAPLGVFSYQPPSAWLAELNAAGRAQDGAVPYIYPPLWAELAAPLATRLDPMAFFDIARAAFAACTAASIWLAWRLMGPGRLGLLPFAAVAILLLRFTDPLPFAAHLGQPQAFVTFLTLLALERFQAGRPTAAGIALGVAAGIKIMPLLVAVVFLASGDRRATLTACATAVALAALSFAVSGIEAHRHYLDLVGEVGAVVPLVGFNTSVHVLLAAAAGAPYPEAGCQAITWPLTAPVALAGWAALAALVAVALRATAPLREADRYRVRALLVPTILLLCAPVAWVHYYMLPLMLLPGLAAIAGRRAALWFGAALVLALSPYPPEKWLDLSLTGSMRIRYAAIVLLLGAILALLGHLARARAPGPAAAPAPA